MPAERLAVRDVMAGLHVTDLPQARRTEVLKDPFQS